MHFNVLDTVTVNRWTLVIKQSCFKPPSSPFWKKQLHSSRPKHLFHPRALQKILSCWCLWQYRIKCPCHQLNSLFLRPTNLSALHQSSVLILSSWGISTCITAPATSLRMFSIGQARSCWAQAAIYSRSSSSQCRLEVFARRTLQMGCSKLCWLQIEAPLRRFGGTEYLWSSQLPL